MMILTLRIQGADGRWEATRSSELCQETDRLGSSLGDLVLWHRSNRKVVTILPTTPYLLNKSLRVILTVALKSHLTQPNGFQIYTLDQPTNQPTDVCVDDIYTYSITIVQYIYILSVPTFTLHLFSSQTHLTNLLYPFLTLYIPCLWHTALSQIPPFAHTHIYCCAVQVNCSTFWMSKLLRKNWLDYIN